MQGNATEQRVYFSVVIPLYNKESTVERAVQSVLAQTVQDFEIVVVDDGSTDGSAHIVRAIADPRIRLIQQPNGGVSTARNRGIAEARHELIAFLDADDEWLPQFLATIRHLVERYPHAGVYATRYYLQYGNRRQPAILRGLPDSFEGILEDYFALASRSHPPIHASAVCVCRRALQSVGGFPVGIASGEDLVTWARLAQRFSICYAATPCTVFHLSASHQIMAVAPTRIHDAGDPVGQILRTIYRETPAGKRRSLSRYLSLWHQMRASVLVRQGKGLAAAAQAAMGLRYNPLNWKLMFLLAVAMLPGTSMKRHFLSLRDRCSRRQGSAI